MPYAFYSSPEYKEKQSIIAKANWKKGKYIFLTKPSEKRLCKSPQCNQTFWVKKHADPKKFCSNSCSAHVSNTGRKMSIFTRNKISKSIYLLPPEKRGHPKIVPRVKLTCKRCRNPFYTLPYLSKIRQFCSIGCSIRTTGRKTTSPKASKGKNGIRKDIDPNINFYSTWEANVARVFNLIELKWEFSPKIFDLGEHTYRPDFYLPDFDMFIEVKNFLSPYSLERDTLFRQKYPTIKLVLILKEDYLEIKSNYEDLVDNWEY